MKTITRLLAVLAFAGWAGSVSAEPITNYVTVGSNQWARPIYFTDISWNYIFTVCGTGSCTGTLTSDSGTWDMDGWTWADVGAVNGMFNTYISDAGGNAIGYPLSGPDSAYELNSTWAPALLSDFYPTGPSFIQIQGWTSTEAYAGAAYIGGVRNFDAPTNDYISTDGVSCQECGFGAWFYRPALPDPMVELIWSATTGTGIPGSSTIVAKAGDVLTLDVLVTPDLNPNDPFTMGLLSAALSVVWETDNLAVAGPAETSIVCPAPPNAFAGSCNDSVDNLFSASSLIEDYSPMYFEAQNVNEPGFFNGETMTLARVWLHVSVKGNYDLNVIYEDAGNQPVDIVTIDSGTSVQLNSQPPATANITGPGC